MILKTKFLLIIHFCTITQMTGNNFKKIKILKHAANSLLRSFLTKQGKVQEQTGKGHT